MAPFKRICDIADVAEWLRGGGIECEVLRDHVVDAVRPGANVNIGGCLGVKESITHSDFVLEGAL